MRELIYSLNYFFRIAKGPRTAFFYIVVCTFISCAGKASTYLECASKDIKTCTKEVTKGEAIIALAKDNTKKFIKIDFVKLDQDKGTLKVNKE